MSFFTNLTKESLQQNYSEYSETSISKHQSVDQMETASFDDQSLIKLHKIYGNKWKRISSHYQNKNDSYIKNHFYSLLRRSLRKLNAYIKSQAKQARQYKIMKLNFVFKLTNMAQLEKNGITNKNTYQKILYEFLLLKDETATRKQGPNEILQETDKQYFDGCKNYSIEKLLKSLKEIEMFFLEHNLNKKGKSKKKCPKKIELKKDIIQRSLSLREENTYQNDEGSQNSLSFNQLSNYQGMNEQWYQMLSFDRDVHTEGFKSMLDEEATFDPTLFK